MTELAGVNADRVSTTAWMLSSLLAGLAGMLISPTLTQVVDIYYTPLVVAAISAAVLAALSSIGVAFLGGLLLGVIAQVVAIELPTNSILATQPAAVAAVRRAVPRARSSRRSCATAGSSPTRWPVSIRRHRRSSRSSAATRSPR